MYNDKKWLEKYNLAKKYYEENGNLLIKKNYKVGDVNLGVWIIGQRRYNKIGKLPLYRKELLDKIGMVWNCYDEEVLDIPWLKMYKEAINYYKEKGNLKVPMTYSYIKDNKEINLGNWIVAQRVNFHNGKLTPKRKELLDEIGMVWKLRTRFSWEYMYNLAKDYYTENGDLLIANTYEVNIEGNSVALGNWITNQRRCYNLGELSNERIKLLNEIGMQWEDVKFFQSEKNWIITFKSMVKYYGDKGTSVIPNTYLVEVNGKLISLNQWYKRQLSLYRNNELTGKRKELMDIFSSIIKDDNVKNLKDIRWMKYYKVAKKYYEENGNLKVPATYETIVNGEVIKLGQWINSQRASYRGLRSSISAERIEMLNNIGMLWNLKENKLVKEI